MQLSENKVTKEFLVLHRLPRMQNMETNLSTNPHLRYKDLGAFLTLSYSRELDRKWFTYLVPPSTAQLLLGLSLFNPNKVSNKLKFDLAFLDTIWESKIHFHTFLLFM